MSLNEHLCEDCSVVSKSHRLTLKISKATGPGSRGGKVLGITRSGKPIYQHGGGTENYHAIDHTDAAEAHGAHGMLARVKGDVGGMNHHRAVAREHLSAAAGPKPAPGAKPLHQRIKEHFSNMGGMGGAAMAHAKSFSEHVSDLSKGGAGSRGGVIVGHTKSGKAVYQDKGVKRYGAKFHAQDHSDAEDIHQALSEKAGKQERKAARSGARNDEATHSAVRERHEMQANQHHQAAVQLRNQAETSQKSQTEDAMNAIDLLKSYLNKSKVRSGNVDADTVDEVDEDLTGAAAMGKKRSAPGGWDDQPAADKKVKRKFTGHEQTDNTHPGTTLESQTGVNDISIKHVTLSNAGPYDCEGGEPGDIDEAAPTRTIDGNVYRSMDENDGDDEELVKGMKHGEGSKGGHIVGHTRNGKPIYNKKSSPKGYTAHDHADAAEYHNDQAIAADDEGHGSESDSAPHQKNFQHHADMAEKMAGGGKKASKIFDGARYTEKSEIANRKNLKTGAGTGKSLDAPDFYKGGNGKMYQRQVHDFGVVQHTAGGMDLYCAELAKGGTFWANGSHWHNTSDPGVAQMVMCKSCDHAHSVMYTACPECEASGDFSKSMAQPNLHFAAPSRTMEPESEIVRFK